MTKKTYGILSRIPLAGAVFKMVCDPMLGCSLHLSEGLPRRVTDYAAAHPDIFITKRLLKQMMKGEA